MNKKLIGIFENEKELKQKKFIPCIKCENEIQVPEEHYLDHKKEKSQPLNFLCPDCTHSEILEKELKLEKEIISKLDINPEKKYSAPEAAQKLGVGSVTVLREIERGKIKSTRGKGEIKPRHSISGKELIGYAKNRHKRQSGAHISPRKRFSAPTHRIYP